MFHSNCKEKKGNLYGYYSPLDDLENKKVKRIYDMMLSQFKDGYEIVFEEADDCDEHDILYWITCKNGCYGRSYDLNSMIERGRTTFDKRIAEDGLFDGNTTYYIDPDIYYFNGEIEVISNEVYSRMMLIRGKLQEILDKYNKFLCNEFSMQDHTNKWFTNSVKLEKLLVKNNQSILSSGRLMMSCIKRGFTNEENNNVDDIFKTKLGLTGQQLKLCGL